MRKSRSRLEVEPKTLRSNALTFALRKSYVSLNDFERFVFEIRATLKSVSRATDGTDDWVLTDLEYGSAVMSFAPASTKITKHDTVTAVIEGFKAIESASAKPSYFPDRALTALRRLSYLADDGQMTVTAPDGRMASLTANTGKTIDVLLRPVRRYFGSVLGSLDIVSVHKAPYITIYGDQGDIVRCYVDESLIPVAKDLLGSRVIVSGAINTNRLGNIVSIRGEELFESPRRNHTPPKETAGAIPEMTGDLSTLDYLTSLRRN